MSSIRHLESLEDDTADIGGIDSALFLKNFHCVASRPPNGVELFFRNVPMLMDLSMTIRDYNLASELGEAYMSHSSILRSLAASKLFTVAI